MRLEGSLSPGSVAVPAQNEGFSFSPRTTVMPSQRPWIRRERVLSDFNLFLTQDSVKYGIPCRHSGPWQVGLSAECPAELFLAKPFDASAQTCLASYGLGAVGGWCQAISAPAPAPGRQPSIPSGCRNSEMHSGVKIFMLVDVDGHIEFHLLISMSLTCPLDKSDALSAAATSARPSMDRPPWARGC